MKTLTVNLFLVSCSSTRTVIVPLFNIRAGGDGASLDTDLSSSRLTDEQKAANLEARRQLRGVEELRAVTLAAARVGARVSVPFVPPGKKRREYFSGTVVRVVNLPSVIDLTHYASVEVKFDDHRVYDHSVPEVVEVQSDVRLLTD